MIISISPTTYIAEPLLFEAGPDSNLEDIPVRAFRHKTNKGAVGENHGRFDADRTLTISAVFTRAENDRLLDMLDNDTEFTLSCPEGLFFGMIESRFGAGGAVNIKFLVLDKASVPVVSIEIPVVPDFIFTMSKDPALVDIYGRRAGSDLWRIAGTLNGTGYAPQGEIAAVSLDGQWAVFGGDTAPHLEFFCRSGNSFTPVESQPSDRPELPVEAVCFSDDGLFMCVSHQTADGGNIDIFKLTDGAWSILTRPSSSMWMANGADFHPAGGYLAVTSSGEGPPGLFLFSISGDTFTSISGPTLDTNPQACKFSYGGDYIAFGHDSYSGSPYFSLYSFDPSDGSMAGQSAPDVAPAGDVTAISWHPDDTYLAVSHEGSPYLTVYAHSAGTLTKIEDPDVLPDSYCPDVCWSSDGGHIVMAGDVYDSVQGGDVPLIYAFSDGVLTQITPSDIARFTAATFGINATGAFPISSRFFGSR